jgi:hypothetical protein
MNSIERRLGQLERYFVPEERDAAAQRAYAAAWDETVDTIQVTMSPEHRNLILETDNAIEAAGHWAAWHVPDGPGRRLWNALRSRILARIGSAPEFDVPPMWPDSPVALPPVVAEVYMQLDVSAGLFVFEGQVCANCCYMVPVLSRREPVGRGQDGVPRWLDGEPAPTPGVPFIAIDGKAWRHIQPIEPCPLCGGSIVKPANWYEGVGVVATRKPRPGPRFP